MKVNQKLNNIFTEIKNIEQLDFFNSVSDTTLNNLYICLHGEKTLNRFSENTDVSEIANYLIELFKSKWTNFYKLSLIEFEELNNNTSEQVTETTQNQVSAYNQDDFTNDNQSIKTYNKEIKGGVNSKKNLVEYLKQDFFINTVFGDVNNILTLKIYDYE